MPIKCYTTSINSGKTVGEIQEILSKFGASKIMLNYENGEPISISFCITVSGNDVYFKLPSNWRGVLNVINKNKSIASKFKTNEQARRVSWRIIREWIDSQLALIESEQAELSEIFLPYAITKKGNTVYELFKEKSQALLD